MAEIVPSSKSYQDLLARLKDEIRTAQVRAVTAVNSELVLLYWRIGPGDSPQAERRRVGDEGH